jgi:hypothetical protein
LAAVVTPDEVGVAERVIVGVLLARSRQLVTVWALAQVAGLVASAWAELVVTLGRRVKLPIVRAKMVESSSNERLNLTSVDSCWLKGLNDLNDFNNLLDNLNNSSISISVSDSGLMGGFSLKPLFTCDLVNIVTVLPFYFKYMFFHHATLRFFWKFLVIYFISCRR